MKWITCGLVVIVAGGVVTGCSAETGFEIIHVQQTDWYPVSLLATFVYLLTPPVLALRAADARVLAALPIIGNTAIASFAVLNLMEFRSEVGTTAFGANAVAAGLAEATVPWCFGAAVSALTSLMIASISHHSDTRATRTRLGTIVLIVAAIAAATTAGLMWYLRTGAGPGNEFTTITWIPFTLSLVGLAVSIVSIIWPRSARTTIDSRWWFWAFAGFSATVAILLFVAGERLTAFAAGRT